MVTLPDAILDCRSPILDCAARVQIPWSHWAGEKLVLTELEGRFRDACFCCAGWNDVASERSLSPPCEGGGAGGGAGGLEKQNQSSSPGGREAKGRGGKENGKTWELLGPDQPPWPPP